MLVKPIQRSVHIQPLSRDHHHGLLCCWKIRQGLKNKIEPARIIQYLSYFWNEDLNSHFISEEELLFAQSSGKLVDQAFKEHKQIRELLYALQEGAVVDATESLKQFADLLDKHIRFEERVLFPYFEESFSAETLKLIGLKLNDSELQKPVEEYADIFWVKQ